MGFLAVILILFMLYIVVNTGSVDEKYKKLKRNTKVLVSDNFDSGFGVIVGYQPRKCVQAGGLLNNSLYQKEAWLVKLDGTEDSRWFTYDEITPME